MCTTAANFPRTLLGRLQLLPRRLSSSTTTLTNNLNVNTKCTRPSFFPKQALVSGQSPRPRSIPLLLSHSIHGLSVGLPARVRTISSVLHGDGELCTDVSRRTHVRRRHALRAMGGSIRWFGGQSVVPWELALFLVEEMKGEGISPGAVVYTAALAECKWAGETRHVEYLLSQLRSAGLDIAPAIPGALNDEPPPSQIPAIYKSTSSAGSEAQLTGAGRTAEAALSTVEGMWAAAAGGDSKYEPTPATSRAALNACAAGGQWERALALVRDAALDDDDGSLNDRSRVAEQVEALALGGQWLEALALVKGKGDLTNS